MIIQTIKQTKTQIIIQIKKQINFRIMEQTQTQRTVIKNPITLWFIQETTERATV